MIAIGIDIGGTYTKFCAVNSAGKILKTLRINTDTALSARAFLHCLADIVNDWKRDFKGEKIVLGVGLPGITDYETGIFRAGPNIPWRNLKVKEALERCTGRRCFIANDASMAAWGVHATELKSKYKNLMVMTLGTGIGGGIIIDGKPYRGATGSAGEIGHTKIDFSANAPLCGCGDRGCLEAFCGAAGIKRAAVAAVKKSPKSILAALMAKEDFSVELLSEAAQRRDKTAMALWHDIGINLGRAVANSALILNPQAVVLTGGVSRGAKYFKKSMLGVLKEQSVKAPFENLRILISKQNNIGGIGAAMYALSKVNEK